MDDKIRKTIELPEITRIEGHASVHVDIENGQVSSVQLEIFEGTRFFERLVIGHQSYEIPHITSRVCAICSTGHVLAAIFAQEAIAGFVQPERLRLFRELMHLGMIIESHATHIFALALPDFVGAKDLVEFATKHKNYFDAWTKLRATGAAIQTAVGGRPFHPVNLQVGGLSHYPEAKDLLPLKAQIDDCKTPALDVTEFLLGLKPAVARTTVPSFLALIPDSSEYGYFGTVTRCSDGWEAPIAEYKQYLQEKTVSYSHAKRTTARGKDMMVGSMARLLLFGSRLKGTAKKIYERSAMASGDTNTILNNLAQAIEVIQALDRVGEIIDRLADADKSQEPRPSLSTARSGSGVGAVECPRGTLYHAYTIDDTGTILAADMITPSVQNTGRIELDIREVVAAVADPAEPKLQSGLETLVRAYDPCNTCATHMVRINYH
jgi:sulfhydrogenase subunit alpha